MKKNKHTIDGTEDFPEFERNVEFNKLEKMGEPYVRSMLDRGMYSGDKLKWVADYLNTKHKKKLGREKLLRIIAIIIAIATSISAVVMVFSAIGGR